MWCLFFFYRLLRSSITRPLSLPLLAQLSSHKPTVLQMLTSRVTLPFSDSPSQEDIFSAAIGTLFTDDTHNSHGSPGGSLTYTSPAFGDIELRIPAHPDVEEGRKLFANYLWNAGILVAEGVERGSLGAVVGKDNGDTRLWDSRWWDVRGKTVLELGAGMFMTPIGLAICRIVQFQDFKLSHGFEGCG